ncbi:hypothetical protein F2P81_023779 [Scophthalmus maximus]|uniref:Uncharacterized protein n=1 Tax=Scophthalmus maximus TaxID=52904 RepID=A0A6A4RS79_SCOMX|nr:hypothetical protein F2P81_023779 [Scophthalmus maximus]
MRLLRRTLILKSVGVRRNPTLKKYNTDNRSAPRRERSSRQPERAAEQLLRAWARLEGKQTMVVDGTLCGYRERVRRMEERRNMSVSGEIPTPHEEGERERRREKEQGEGRKTSPRNLLPQHSSSDVVWHLVHKANQIHTLTSYISGKGNRSPALGNFPSTCKTVRTKCGTCHSPCILKTLVIKTSPRSYENKRPALSSFRPARFAAKSRILSAVKYIEFDNSKKDFSEG